VTTIAHEPDLRSITEQLRASRVPMPDTLAALAATSIRIATARTTLERLPIGASRFGGDPDVPASFVWPQWQTRPLGFLAQLDLSEVRAPGLPSSGWLLFFYDQEQTAWGSEPSDVGAARVVHVDVSRDQLVRVTRPPESDEGGGTELCAVTFRASLDLPHEHDLLVEDAGVELEDDEGEAYDAVRAAISGVEDGDVDHHLLGHPQIVQGDMRGDCQLVTNGIATGDPSAYRGKRAQALLKTASADWQLLLQLDSDDTGPEWMWGDSGRVFFWIRRADLATKSFEKAWCILQCY